MSKRDTQTGAFLVLEVLGANVFDLASFMNVSRTAAAGYSGGTMAATKERQEALDELTTLIVKAGSVTGIPLPAPGPDELKRLRHRYFRLSTLIGRLVLRVANGHDHRAYALRTQRLLNELDPLIANREAKDPIATIVGMARARNTKRLHNHSLDKIACMEATLAGFRTQQQEIIKVLNKHDRGWKKRALEAAKEHKEKLAGKK